MSSLTKKIIASVTAITCAVWLVGPGAAGALTASELQAQIDALLAQLSTLQGQLTTLQGGTTSGTAPAACSGVTFSRNLSQGASGADVKCLQALLNQSSDTKVAASGAGSPGNESTYFGSLTKAAVVKFQEKYAPEVLTPVGLTAGNGFVGAKTRAKLTSLLGATPTTSPSPTTTTSPSPTTLPTASGLTVSLASDTPVAATIISDGSQSAAGSQALVPVLKMNFSTPAGTSAKVTTIKFKRLGVSSDTDISNAYLYEGDTKVADMTSLSSGVLTFTNSAGVFSVSGSRALTLKFDLHKDASSGKTVGFGITAAADIVTDASAVNATFPMNGNLMTVATVTDFGRVQITTSTSPSTVDPGTNYEAYKMQVTASNQKIRLSYVKFRQLGSIAAGDVSNLALWSGSTQIGSTIAALNSDGTVVFDLASAPFDISAGSSKILSLKLDVVKGSTRTIQFSIQKSTDVVVMDTNYGVYITPDNGTIGTWSSQDGQPCSVNSGNIVISKRSDSPSGNATLNGTNITLAKFDAKAIGEDIKISSLKFTASSSEWEDIKNGVILVDGVQQGTTQSQVASNTAYTVNTNFTIEAAKTVVIEIRADIVAYTSTGAALGANDQVKGVLTTGASGNAQRMSSLGTFTFPASDQSGNTLTISSASLSSAKNASLGNVQSVYNVDNVTIGSFILSAGAAEGVDISSVVFQDATSATTTGSYSLGAAFTNLKLYRGTTQLGSTIVPNTSDAAGTDYTFYITPALSVAAGQSIVLDLKAKVLAAGFSWSNGEATALLSAEGTGKVTSNTITETNGVAGQTITLTGAGSIGLEADVSTPEAALVNLGKAGVTLGIWKIKETTSIEDLKLTSIVFFNATTNATSSSNIKNLKLYCGDTQFGETVEALNSNSAVSDYYYGTFSVDDANACTIPKGGYKLLKLTGDFTSYSNSAYPTGGPITAGSDWAQFYTELPASITGVSTDYIIAKGAGDYASSTNSSSSANKVYPYRTSLSMAIACGGTCTHGRASSDKVASLTLTGTSEANAQFRASVTGDDEATTNWAVAWQGGDDIATSVVTEDTTVKIDGTYSIFYDTNVTAAEDTTTYAVVSMGTADLSQYSKLSMWIYPTGVEGGTTTGLEIMIASSSGFTAGVGDNDISQTSSAGTLATGTWNFITMNLNTTVSTDTWYAGILVRTDAGTNEVGWYIDNIRAYNDSIGIDVTGNTTDTASGTAFTLKTTGGTTKATGYLGLTNTVTLIPDSTIEAGSTPVSYDLYADTITLMRPVTEVPTGAVLGLNIDFGTADSAADVRWYDQGGNIGAPVTWVYGTTPISVTLTY